ncbi:MAG: RNA-directed DNA polymerase [Deltaproteobacteria bacterium]|nr:RNA-directed DNA polymerase [Deltaproteobacteria bacterium]
MLDVLRQGRPGPSPFWVGLVARVRDAFGPTSPPPTLDALTRMLAEDPIFDEDYRAEMALLTEADGWKTPPYVDRLIFRPVGSRFRPGAAAAEWPVPRLESVPELAAHLEVPEATLEGWADVGGWLGRYPSDRRQHYVRRWIPGVPGRRSRPTPLRRAAPGCAPCLRSSGGSGPRLIEAPKTQLAKMQRRILRSILDLVPVHPAAHGFVRGRSIRTHAARHVHMQVVLRFDLRRFFPSVQAPRVQGLFRYLGYPEEVARLLAGLCTTITPHDVFPPRTAADVRQLYRQRHLPQGAPTSPALANLLCLGLDRRMMGLARAFDAGYSRYADDLVFSGGAALAARSRRFGGFVARVVEEEGFLLNHDKTRRMPRSGRQEVTGLVVNQGPAYPRDEFDRLKAILHQCALDGPERHNREGHPDFRAHLLGRVSFVESVDPRRGAKLRVRFERIRWGSSQR